MCECKRYRFKKKPPPTRTQVSRFSVLWDSHRSRRLREQDLYTHPIHYKLRGRGKKGAMSTCVSKHQRRSKHPATRVRQTLTVRVSSAHPTAIAPGNAVTPHPCPLLPDSESIDVWGGVGTRHVANEDGNMDPGSTRGLCLRNFFSSSYFGGTSALDTKNVTATDRRP
jgi:hypothetical protein